MTSHFEMTMQQEMPIYESGVILDINKLLFKTTIRDIDAEGGYPSVAKCLARIGRKSYDDGWLTLRRDTMKELGYNTDSIGTNRYKKVSDGVES
jgi:hypothetical protein